MNNFENAYQKLAAAGEPQAPWAWGLALVHRGQKSGAAVYFDFLSVSFGDNAKSFALIAAAAGQPTAAQATTADAAGGWVIIPDAALKNLASTAFATLEAASHPNAAAIRAAAEHERELALVFLARDAAPASCAEVFLKLHLLSRCFVRPRQIELSGAFGLLKNLAWDEHGAPYELEYLRENEAALKCAGRWPNICMIDKFPRYLQSVLPPENVRILDAAKVRLGAHLAAGTTLMPGASYVNFNAGTLGAAMVEGRISSAAIVGANSDVGGGASILGVLSGTDGTPISVGERCLLGANSTTGVPLGDDCVLDAGCAALSGAKVRIIGAAAINAANATSGLQFAEGQVCKLSELAGLCALHIRRDSRSGELQVHYNKKAVSLNAELH